jgi:hypothetical protein
VAPIPPDAAPVIARRTLLRGLGAGALLVSAGCSASDPAIRGARTGTSVPAPGGEGSGPTPTPTAPPTLPGSAAAADAEDSVATLAAALVTSTDDLTGGQRRVVAAVRDAHRLHAAVLRSPDPTARSTMGVSAAPTAAKPKTVSLDALIAAEKSLATRQAGSVSSSRGLVALLFGSLSVAATSYAAALAATGNVPITRPTANPPTPQVLDDVAGVQGVLTQLYPLIYGYQLAIGKMSLTSSAGTRASNGLLERRALRDQLISLLLARNAAVPAAEAAYVPSVRVVDSGSAGRLIATMETAFLPFTGQWLAAAARPADQQLAWAVMRRAAVLARTWGGPISTWPGWYPS